VISISKYRSSWARNALESIGRQEGKRIGKTLAHIYLRMGSPLATSSRLKRNLEKIGPNQSRICCLFHHFSPIFVDNFSAHGEHETILSTFPLTLEVRAAFSLTLRPLCQGVLQKAPASTLEFRRKARFLWRRSRMKRPTIIPSPGPTPSVDRPAAGPRGLGRRRALRRGLTDECWQDQSGKERSATGSAVREQRIASIMKPQAQRIRALVGRGMSRGYPTTRSVRCAFRNDGLKSKE
jgi:hypothetical protein